MDDSRVAHIVSELAVRYGFAPVLGAELECYAEIRGQADDWWAPLHKRWLGMGFPLLRIEKERGEHQYELVLGLNSAIGTVQTLHQIQRDIAAHGHENMTPVFFASKPYENQPASGLHLHMHLQNAEGANIYTKDEEVLSDALSFSIGGVLACMKHALPFYCPYPEDYVRFDDVDHVPRRNCWGANNRYCALRIPPTQTMYDKHIELRVPSSSANPADAVAAFLASVLVGLDMNIPAPDQEYGKPEPDFIHDVNENTLAPTVIAAFSALLASSE